MNEKNKSRILSVVLVCSLILNGYFFVNVGGLTESNKSLKHEVSQLQQKSAEAQNLIQEKDNYIYQQNLKLQAGSKSTPRGTQVNSKLQSAPKVAAAPRANRQNSYKAAPAPQAAQQNSYTVYITRTGSKYHRAGCQYLRQSCIKSDVNSARARGLTPCSVCCP